MKNYYIGLDYGTSFTKCIVRDEDTNEIWPVTAKPNPQQVTDLLINSEIIVRGTNVTCAFMEDFKPEELAKAGEKILRNLKMALVAAARDQWQSSWLKDVALFSPSKATRAELTKYVERLVGFYLTNVVKLAYDSIKANDPQFDPQTDKVGLHLSVPVAYSSDKPVMKAFGRVATKALQLAHTHFGKEWPNGDALLTSLGRIRGREEFKKACKVIPEVNAAITSFLRSREVTPGVYFVIDIGAGTIDMSIFHYLAILKTPLNFFGADVQDLGSAQLEIRAIDLLERDALPFIRDFKVQGSLGARMVRIEDYCKGATKEVQEAVTTAAIEVLNQAVKLYGRTPPLINHSLIFVGGGGDDPRYRDAIKEARAKMYLAAGGGIVHTPVPTGIRWPKPLIHEDHNCFRRFTVAFGLSFNPTEFTKYKGVEGREPYQAPEPQKAEHFPLNE